VSRETRTAIALDTDRIIHSPGVPVFRDDDANLLENPYRVSFLTAAAPNAERARSLPQEERDRIADVLRIRAGKVLGAWGCGVFGNDAETVAGVFRDHLRGPYANRFSQVVFAVLDHSPRQEQRNIFERALRTVQQHRRKDYCPTGHDPACWV
jgi:uncharacterized protein (TIGR02452 family)